MRKVVNHMILILALLVLGTVAYGLVQMPFSDLRTTIAPPPEIDRLTQALVKAFHDGAYADLAARMQAEAKPSKELFEQVRATIPPQQITDSFYSYYKGFRYTSLLDDTRTATHNVQLAHRYAGVPGFGLYTVQFREDQGRLLARSVFFSQNSLNWQDISRFPTDSRPLTAWLFAALVPMYLISIGFCFWVIFRSNIRNKWLWYIIVMISAGKFTLNWSSGVFFAGISIQILGLGISKNGLFQPWLVDIPFPLGITIFGSLFSKIKKEAEIPVAAEPVGTGHDR